MNSIDTFFDSDDLMSWLLLNPDLVDYDDFTNNANNNIHPLPADDVPDYCTTFPDSTAAVNSISSDPVLNNVCVKTEPHDSKASPPQSQHKGLKLKDVRLSSRRVSKIGRKRERESVEDIEARVNELKSENADLQAHYMNVTQRTTEVQKQRVAMERLMVAKLNLMNDRGDSDQSELAGIVKQYTDIYADYGKCRQREVGPGSPCACGSIVTDANCVLLGGLSSEPTREAAPTYQDYQDVSMGSAAGQVVLPEVSVSHVRPAVQGAGADCRADREDTESTVRTE